MLTRCQGTPQAKALKLFSFRSVNVKLQVYSNYGLTQMATIISENLNMFIAHQPVLINLY